MSIREMGYVNSKYPEALPIGEFETLAQAESMLVLVGRRLIDGEYAWSIQLPSSPDWMTAWPSGNVQAVFEAEEWIEQFKAKRLAR